MLHGKRFLAGLPFPVRSILDFRALRDWEKNAKLPLDQSAAYILGLFQRKQLFVFFGGGGFFCGNEEDLRGTKKSKSCTKFWYTFLGVILTLKLVICQNVGSRSVFNAKFSSISSGDFPGILVGHPRGDPRNSYSPLEFSELS